MKTIKFVLMSLVTAILVGCGTTSTVPITGRKQTLLVSDGDVLSLSNQQYKQYMQSAKASTNATNTAMVKRVGQNLANAVTKYLNNNGLGAEVANYAWEFNLVQDKQVNAWCMPGGKIVVYEGILPVTQDEASLAIVLGHEIAHAVAKHSAERLSNEYKNQYGTAILGAVVQGADGVKCTATPAGFPTLEQLSRFVEIKGSALDICTHLRTTELTRTVTALRRILEAQKNEQSPFDNGVHTEMANVCLDVNDEIGEVIKVVHQLGYDLSDEDNAKVYDEFKRVAAKKHFVGTRELDAIVASTAMQVPSAYKIESYVINSGNVISATANITLEKDGQKLKSVAVGDGPVDAAFLAIEQIIGHHYELDDFQIQTVTEGREAMGSALVKLRAGGKLYSGNGISTDIIGASIRAYISALNKIVYEEA